MWNRIELKQRGKEAFKKNYLASVVAAFVMTIVASGSASVGSNATSQEESVGFILAIGTMALFLLTIFVFNVLEVGGCRFFLENRTSQPKISVLISMFRSSSYVNVVAVQVLRMVKIFLWSLLLVIPGIIKTYEYRMVPYILSEHPEIEQKNAFLVSRNMMNGHKMELFIFDLSFFGWFLLAAVTFNIAGIFYTYPYYQATMAEVFECSKANYRM